ncbi:hypothetical protein ACTFIZ_004957 [Dictyostelium cf. discoideum]
MYHKDYMKYTFLKNKIWKFILKHYKTKIDELEKYFVFGIGDASFKSRYGAPVLGKQSIINLFKYEGFSVCLVDEYLTSQIDPKEAIQSCKSVNDNIFSNLHLSSIIIDKLQRLVSFNGQYKYKLNKITKVVVHRDIVGSLNILTVLKISKLTPKMVLAD